MLARLDPDVRRVTFAVTYPPEGGHPIHREIREDTPVTRMELLVWGPTATVRTLAWYDAERSVVSSLLDGVEVVEEATYVAGDGGTYVFSIQERFALDQAVMEVVRAARVAFLPPVTFTDDGKARVDAVGEQSALSALRESLGEALPTRIERVRDFERQPMRRQAASLTDRQYAALNVAVDVGYYEVPRSGGVADVADALGCGTSTAGELLRKAERAVLTGFVETG